MFYRLFGLGIHGDDFTRVLDVNLLGLVANALEDGGNSLLVANQDDIGISIQRRLSRTADQAGPTDQGVANAVEVTYNTVDEANANFGFTAGESNITLNEGGKYLVAANTYLTTASNDSDRSRQRRWGRNLPLSDLQGIEEHHHNRVIATHGVMLADPYSGCSPTTVLITAISSSSYGEPST